MRLLRIIREALLYLIFGTVFLVFILYLIWVTSMVADCAH